MMRAAALSCILFACLASGQLLRADKMHLGEYNPETKHYEKPLIGQDGHDQRHHGQPLLGEDGHDQEPHAQPLIGQDGHDQRHHGQPLLGQDGHDQYPHGQPLLGQDGHDQHQHGQHMLGEDGHGQHHGQHMLGQDGHDQHHHGQHMLGQDGHDQQHHGQHMLGQDGHDQQHHGQHLLGQDGHGQQRHGQHMLGQDGHDQQHHGQHLLGQDGHDQHNHGQRLLGGGDHDYKKHGGQRLIGQGDHDYKKHGQKQAQKLNHYLAFEEFVTRHNKSYDEHHEYNHRLSVFTENMRKVHVLQHSEQGTATYGATKFADLTEAEFRQLLGFRPDLKPANSNMQKVLDVSHPEALPTSVDWRDQGVVTPVKNQGMCGSCWAFSVTGNVEGQWAIKHNKLISLSEQELVDCDKEDQGCNGGLPENAYDAIAKLGGLETEDDYPYDAADEQCHFNKSMAAVTVNGSVELPQDETKLAKWLVKNGPISIGINANALQFYMGGVSHPLKFLCNPADLDHGMLIVGYGVHTTKYLHRHQPYWLVKNSWGEDWGEQGYYRVYRGDGTCGVNMMATSAVVV